MIEKAGKIRNQIVDDCEVCKGKGKDGCKCIKKGNLIVELAYANIPFEYWFLSIKGAKCSKTAKDKIKRYCLKLKKAKKMGLGLCLYGKFGRGKTSLAIHVLKKASMSGFSVYFLTLSEILNEIKSSFNYEGEELSKIEYERDKNLVQSKFLVIDNVGQEYRRSDNDFVPIVFDEIIRKRKSNHNVTIITTNKDPKKLKELYGGALYSILESSLKKIEIRGTDHRRGLGDKLWREL